MGLVKKIRDYRSKSKVELDSMVDPLATIVGGNLAYTLGGSKILEFVANNTDNHQGLAMLGAYAGLAYGLKPLNKLLWKSAKKLNERSRERISEIENGTGKPATALSWLKSIGVAGAIGSGILSPHFEESISTFKEDGQRVISAFERSLEHITETEAYLPAKLDEQNRFHPLANYLSQQDIARVPKNTDEGRFLRTARWHGIISEAESKYEIPEGLLSGLVMRESRGNPLALNSGDDGGAGAFQFQPGTARHYGLNIYVNSNRTGRDLEHGRNMRGLVERYNQDYNILSEKDDRFHLAKAADAAARLLRDEYQAASRRGDEDPWRTAVAAYNAGRARALRHLNTNHTNETLRYREYYNQRMREIKNDEGEKIAYR